MKFKTVQVGSPMLGVVLPVLWQRMSQDCYSVDCAQFIVRFETERLH